MLFIIDRMGRSNRHKLIDIADEALTLSDENVALKVFNHSDMAAFFDLYMQIANQFDEPPIQSDDTPDNFAQRIASACELIWTIRVTSRPDVVIGDCALHHWDRQQHEIAFGGSLMPEYWGRGIMASALQLVSAFAKTAYGVKAFHCTTSSTNHKAIRFAEKMGFDRIAQSDHTVSLKKII